MEKKNIHSIGFFCEDAVCSEERDQFGRKHVQFDITKEDAGMLLDQLVACFGGPAHVIDRYVKKQDSTLAFRNDWDGYIDDEKYEKMNKTM